MAALMEGVVHRVCLLGEQVLLDDASDRVRMASTRALTLLAHLVVAAPIGQPRHRIAGCLWPDSTDPQALTNLRRELHYLRIALDDDPSLVVSPTELSWRDTDTCEVDVRRLVTGREQVMEAARNGEYGKVLRIGQAALDAYRGEFMPGVEDD